MALRGKLELTLFEVEGAAGLEINAAAETVHLFIRRGDFRDLDRPKRIGRNHIERKRTVAAIRRGDAHAIELDGVQIRADAADDDEAALALVAVERDAGNALDRFGGVLVGKTADVVGCDDTGEGFSGTLLVDRAGRAHRAARDDEGIELHRFRAERKVDRRGTGRGDGDRLRGIGITDVGKLQRLCTCRHVEERVITALVGERFERRPGDAHPCAAESESGGVIGYATDHRARGDGLGGGGVGKHAGQRE